MENVFQVTIYHWDLPQVFQDQGGWQNSSIADWYAAYSNVVFEKFGDRVITNSVFVI